MWRRKTNLFCSLWAVALVLPLLAVSPLASAGDKKSDAVAVVKEQLLFVSTRDGELEIYTMASNGAEVKQLTHNDADDYQPAWSADGRRIAYVSKRDGNSEIYVMDADGSSNRRLTNHPGADIEPRWSPGADYLTFISDRDGYINVYVLEVATGKLVNVSQSVSGTRNPRWSPQGGLVSFEEFHGKGVGLVVVKPDGSGKRSLTNNTKTTDMHASWSPDGRQLVFASRRNKMINIYLIDDSGDNERKLTDTIWIDSEPVWSPDGTKISFLSARDDGTRRQVYVMNVDGSDQHRVVSSGAEEMNLSWSAHDNYLYHASYRDGNAEIYRMKADGTDVSRLTNHLAHDDYPVPAPAINQKALISAPADQKNVSAVVLAEAVGRAN